MKYLKIKNKKIYKLFYSVELKKLKFKFVFQNTNLPFYIRQSALRELNKINCSYVNIKQRCFLTNNSRSVFKQFKLSRIKLRNLISNNFINGVKKSSW